ncbi:MAG: hypothetical protein K0Q76_4285 [Panacagrimonas sp.]|jgi:hypothetical protein|nr:polysaccharide pyruvyl transferase family protein [Panacagrimonas sp.]MCC2659177.1 hypothetical protein [Panacagrimonas sp.]
MAKILVFNDTTRYRHYGCDLVMNSLHRNLRERGHRSQSVHWVGTGVSKRFDAIVRAHRDADAIVVNGEGVIHHDRKHALELANLAGRAKDAGLPAHLVNAALFENSPALYRALSRYDSVFVRDGESRAAARSHGIEAHEVPDLSFDAVAHLGLAPVPRSGLLVTDHVDPGATRRLREVAQTLGGRWRPLMRGPVIPHAWVRLLGARRFLRDVARSEWVLSGRFHAVTLCIATRTPFLAISSNTRKIEALLLDVFGNADRLLPAIPDAEALRARRATIPFTPQEHEALDAYLRTGTVRTRAMFDRLLD